MRMDDGRGRDVGWEDGRLVGWMGLEDLHLLQSGLARMTKGRVRNKEEKASEQRRTCTLVV